MSEAGPNKALARWRRMEWCRELWASSPADRLLALEWQAARKKYVSSHSEGPNIHEMFILTRIDLWRPECRCSHPVGQLSTRFQHVSTAKICKCYVTIGVANVSRGGEEIFSLHVAMDNVETMDVHDR